MGMTDCSCPRGYSQVSWSGVTQSPHPKQTLLSGVTQITSQKPRAKARSLLGQRPQILSYSNAKPRPLPRPFGASGAQASVVVTAPGESSVQPR